VVGLSGITEVSAGGYHSLATDGGSAVDNASNALCAATAIAGC